MIYFILLSASCVTCKTTKTLCKSKMFTNSLHLIIEIWQHLNQHSDRKERTAHT